MDETGLENAAILLMSLGEEDAAEVLKHLTPKEVQGVGETISRMKSIPRDRVENVLEMFTSVAGDNIQVLALTLEGGPIKTVDATTRTFFFGVGGILLIAADQPEGVYQATFNVNANYQ